MEHEYVGTLVRWENETWYVDMSDEEFKDDEEEISLFLLPEKYANSDECDELYRHGNVDSVGVWVYAHLVNQL